MADAVISAVAQRLIDTAVELVRSEVNMVRGVEKEVLDLSNDLKRTRGILDDAERRGFKDKGIKDWLKRLQDACYEMDDVLDEWDYNLLKQQMEQSTANFSPKRKVCSFIPSSPSSCFSFKKASSRHHIAKKLQQVKAQLDRILKEKEQYNFMTSHRPVGHVGRHGRDPSTSLIEVEDICGRYHEKKLLLDKLLADEGAGQQQLGIKVISIVGLGGIGKTTLAQLVYNDSSVKDCYPLMIWICVSDPFDLSEIAKGIVEKVQGGPRYTNQLDVLLENLRNTIMGKKFLLVLDDVWTEDYSKWEPLKICLNVGEVGSKVLVSTRNERVARMMGTAENEIHHLGVLSDHDCWLLLSHIALSDKHEQESENFKTIGKEVAKKCKGLPLAAKTIGSLLRFKHNLEEWENLLNSEIWELEKMEVDIFPHLLLSYNELSPVLKRCFSYCAIFPKNSNIKVESLIRSWLALGYLGSDGSTSELELIGREYFDNLATRSLFQDFVRVGYKKHVVVTCKMHDIVHDFAQFLRNNTCDKVQATCQACNPSLISRVREYRSLFYYQEPAPYICHFLTKLKVLELKNCGIESIPKDVEKLIHLRYLGLSNIGKSSVEDLKAICKLYNLKILILSECKIEEIPEEIGNLIRLRHLDLSYNESLKELPESICDLNELWSLNIERCKSLSGFPQGSHKLVNLRHVHIQGAFSTTRFPDQVIGQLSGLRTLKLFRGRLSCLQMLNQLSGSLQLIIPKISSGEDVVEAAGAKLFKKARLDQLHMEFNSDGRDERKHGVDEQLCMGVLDALKPHPNLNYLVINSYMGSKLPDWITSPLNQLKRIEFYFCNLMSLSPLGKLRCLEQLQVINLWKLEFVGRDLLGITKDMENIESSSQAIGFPKLTILRFQGCPIWREWEDITAEEEASATLSLFPCLKELYVVNCWTMSMLPHRLLRKASSLEELHINGSRQLRGHYDKSKDGSSWEFISHIPRITFEL